jgi:hypothetical protein
MRSVTPLLLLVVGAMVPQMAAAQSRSTSSSTVRYRYGDNPHWADPNFDDTSWTAATNGQWPLPPFGSDGIVWVRLRIPLSADPAARSALRLVGPESRTASEEVFLEGALIAQSGQLPPAPQAVIMRSSTVLDAVGIPAQAPFAAVALRLWYPPAVRYGGRDFIFCQIASAALLNEQHRADKLAFILSCLPVLSLNGLLALVGIGLLSLWYWSRRRELLWFSLLLLFYPLSALIYTLPVLTSRVLTMHFMAPLFAFGNVITMFITVEFLWTIFDLRARPLRIVLHSAWLVFISATLLIAFATSASSRIGWIMVMARVALYIFNFVTLLIELRFLVTGPSRAIAAAMAVIPVASTLMMLQLDPVNLFGIPRLELFNTGYLLTGAFLSVMLVRRALAESRQGAHLRIEVAAAREVQQRLVPAALPQLDRIRLEAAYLPAQEVGGDFYQILPQIDGSTLIVIGDVSGKGMKAAMTGALVLGGLRSLAREGYSPRQILTRLNDQFVSAPDGGFVTCLCARLDTDGELTLANAGHLSPYRNGEEVPLESGLPLGITTHAEYTETRLQLAPGDSLTFLSDGVIEARNSAGELYGFDRTRQISTQSAEAIAAAAQSFGQEDDITVLTLAFARVEVLHA